MRRRTGPHQAHLEPRFARESCRPCGRTFRIDRQIGDVRRNCVRVAQEHARETQQVRVEVERRIRIVRSQHPVDAVQCLGELTQFVAGDDEHRRTQCLDMSRVTAELDEVAEALLGSQQDRSASQVLPVHAGFANFAREAESGGSIQRNSYWSKPSTSRPDVSSASAYCECALELRSRREIVRAASAPVRPARTQQADREIDMIVGAIRRASCKDCARSNAAIASSNDLDCRGPSRDPTMPPRSCHRDRSRGARNLRRHRDDPGRSRTQPGSKDNAGCPGRVPMRARTTQRLRPCCLARAAPFRRRNAPTNRQGAGRRRAASRPAPRPVCRPTRTPNPV